MTLQPYTAPVLEGEGLVHGFFTRKGGVSKGLYESLNCGPGSADRPEAVLKNRKRVATHLVGAEEPINTLYQVHSPRVVLLDKALARGKSLEADAMVTNKKDLILGVLTADCAPVLLYDPKAKVIGAVHAGWRGALAGVLANTVATMVQLGSKPPEIRAGIGPTISFDNYEVDGDFRKIFLEQNKGFEKYFKARGGAKFTFDLVGFCSGQLAAAGLKKVEALGLDTYGGEQEFFSYRRTCHRAEADYGRQLSAIALV